MLSRRDFIKCASAAAGGATWLGDFAAVLNRALAIEPARGSTFRDAEHIVILMQENRSFDHVFGSLRGVRGFNDPRAIRLADRNPVWVQPDAAGKRYVPFHLDIKETRSTWMGSLPHSWPNQVDARNNGQYDRWIPAKRSGRKEYQDWPLTLGYYAREDIPFYYALADAFTICDQHFCSSLTGTNANRLYLWTGTIRERPSEDSIANVENSDVTIGKWASWKTFPERLEEHGIPWKFYQNEIALESGLSEEQNFWLSNFDDNPLEWFRQFNVLFAGTHRAFLEKSLKTLPAEIEALRKQLESTSTTAEQNELRQRIDLTAKKLKEYEIEFAQWTPEKFDQLSPREKSLHARAFCTNTGDPTYRQLTEMTYRAGSDVRRVAVPKGDLLWQFRRDVANGALPTVSWLVPPEAFSDHPSSAWYGAWYLSEVLDILTSNPEVWKKTIFILTYDENDGYFDHVPPFVAPHPRKPETGKVSPGIDASIEYVELEKDRRRTPGRGNRESSIGLGYRVPLIVASPWSRGGCVCSQVFDHTSVLQFLEKFLTHKTGQTIAEPNISRWRRAVCGDLTSVFQSADEAAAVDLPFLQRDAVVESIHRAKFQNPPTGFRPLTSVEIEQIQRDPRASQLLPRQEPGVRRSCPLPYELNVSGSLNEERNRFGIRLAAGKSLFGDRAAGAPFTAYAFVGKNSMTVRNYALDAGAALDDDWALSEFDQKMYEVHVHGPNGFFREFRGNDRDPLVRIRIEPARSGDMEISIAGLNRDRAYSVELRDHAYGNTAVERTVPPMGNVRVSWTTKPSHGWYDFGVAVADASLFYQRFAGRVEIGQWSVSDPAMS